MSSTNITAVQHTEEAVFISTSAQPIQTATPPDTQGEDLSQATTPQTAAATATATATITALTAPKSAAKPAPQPVFATTTEAAAEKKDQPARHRKGLRGAFSCPATAAAFPPSPSPKLPQFAPSPPSPVETGIRRKQSAPAATAKTAARRTTVSGPASGTRSAARQLRKSTGSTFNMPPPSTSASANSPRRTGTEWGLRKGTKVDNDDSGEDTPPPPRRTSTKRAKVDDDEADDTPRPKRRNNAISPSPFYQPEKHERQIAESRGNKRSSLANSGWSSPEAEPDNQLGIYTGPPAEANDQEKSIAAPSPSPRPSQNCRPKGHFPKVMPLKEQDIVERRGSQQWEDPCLRHIAEGDVVKLCEAYHRDTERLSGIIDAYEKAKVEAEDTLLRARGDIVELDKDLAGYRECLKEAKASAKVLEELVERSRKRYESDDDHLDGEPSTRNRSLDRVD